MSWGKDTYFMRYKSLSYDIFLKVVVPKSTICPQTLILKPPVRSGEMLTGGGDIEFDLGLLSLKEIHCALRLHHVVNLGLLSLGCGLQSGLDVLR